LRASQALVRTDILKCKRVNVFERICFGKIALEFPAFPGLLKELFPQDLLLHVQQSRNSKTAQSVIKWVLVQFFSSPVLLQTCTMIMGSCRLPPRFIKKTFEAKKFVAVLGSLQSLPK
jgi:hypothetical protein